jgi:hypothetical protein
MPRQLAAALTCLALLFPSGLAAQMQITVGGFGGAIIPASDLVDVLIPDVGALRFGHKTGWNAGGRFAVWPSSRIGIEVEAAFVGSNVDVRGILPPDFAEDTTINGTMFVGSLNLMYAVIAPPLDPVAVYISGGAGIVSRGGDFWEGAESTTDFAGVVGVGLRYGLGPGWRIRFDVRDYISSFIDKELDEILEPAGGTGSKLQNDIMLTAGVEFFFSPGQ